MNASRWRVVLAWVLAAAGLVAIALLGARGAEGSPFDPRSTDPTGTKALVLLLEELGAQVVLGSQVEAGTDVAVVVADGFALSPDQEDDLERHLDGGGTVVVTDPFSPLTPPLEEQIGLVGPIAVEERLDPDPCDVPALRGVGTIEVLGAFSYRAQAGDSSCYGVDDGAYVVVGERRGGTLVALGGTVAFTNEHLGTADNAVLAAALMAPAQGTTVTWLTEDPADAVPESPFALIGPGPAQGLLQLVVAFVLYAIWRARRLGRPLRELQPVEIAGSELVVAVGDLLQRMGRPERAGAALRSDLHRRLARRFGLAADAPADAVAAVVAERSGVSRERLEAALWRAPVTDDRSLVDLAREIDAIQEEALHGDRG